MTGKNLGKDMLDIGIASIFAGGSIEIIEASPLPAPFKTGTGSLIGLNLAKGVLKKFD